MTDVELNLIQLKELKLQLDKEERFIGSRICQNAIDLISNQIDCRVMQQTAELDLETMIDNLPKNRILYNDSGLWMIIDEENFNTTDKMLFQVARFQQTTTETFTQFIKRCFDDENEYYITE